MIPVVAIVRFRRAGARDVRLWLPLFIVWLLLLPLILVLLPVVIIVLAAARSRPFATLAAAWCCFSALRGTRIELDSQSQALFIHII
jgi:hypothetical protein